MIRRTSNVCALVCPMFRVDVEKELFVGDHSKTVGDLLKRQCRAHDEVRAFD